MGFLVRIEDTGQSFDVEPGETILAAALRQDTALPHDCTLGGCGACRIRLAEGAVEYDELPFGLSEAEAAQGYALACQARPLADLTICVPAPTPLASEPQRCTAEVLEVRQASHDICVLRLGLPPELSSRLAYQPGQHLRIHLSDDCTRSYSMARASATDGVELHIRQIPQGRFSGQKLAALRTGDRLDIELPLGSFYHRAKDERPLLMLATGTGIAPLRGILESLLDSDDCPPVHLYWGMRDASDLYLHDELQSWRERLYEFNYVPVLSRPSSGWIGRQGHVQQAACEDFDDLSEFGIYLCGSPTMIAEARQAFLGRGASAEHLYVDGFSFQ